MPGPRRDLFSEFFDAIEAMGEYWGIHLGRYRKRDDSLEWFHFRHQEYDGLGALSHHLRTTEQVEIELPQTSEQRPSTWTLLCAFVRLLVRALRPRKCMKWRALDSGWRPRSSAESRPTASAWSLFSQQETTELRALARARGVSLNAWLLWSLKEALLPQLVPGSGTLDWRIPVNMRGALPTDGETANHALALEVSLRPEASPGEVDAAIREEKSLHRIWFVAAFMYRFAWVLSRRTFRRLAIRALSTDAFTGGFSNMGVVAPVGDAADVDEWWIPLNPVIKTSPIGVACFTWRGRLTLTLQLHPALATDPQVARNWLASWRGFATEAGQSAILGETFARA
jgi:hypothetical protein